MEINEEKSAEKEINNKKNNVLKFLQQYNKANIEISKPKKLREIFINKENKTNDAKNKAIEKNYNESDKVKKKTHKTNLLIKLKDNNNNNINEDKKLIKAKVETKSIGKFSSTGVILPQIKINKLNKEEKDKMKTPDILFDKNSNTITSIKSLMNNSNINFFDKSKNGSVVNDKNNNDNYYNNFNSKDNICIIQKSNTGNSNYFSNCINEKERKKIFIKENRNFSNSKGIEIPKINLLKSNKSMNHMTFLSSNKNNNEANKNLYLNSNSTSNLKSNINSELKIKNRKKNSSCKLRSLIDSQHIADSNMNYQNNNSSLNDSIETNREIDNKNSNPQNKKNENNFEKENYNSNIEIKETLILEKPKNQDEDDKEEIYYNGFENLENSDIFNENNNKETIDISINILNSANLKEKSENKINKNLFYSNSIKETKSFNSSKENSSYHLRKNRKKGINNTFAKSHSPPKLMFQNGKISSEFTSIKEVEEKKNSSPEPKANGVIKNIVNFNNPTKMNLFCINKEKFFLYLINPGNNSEMIRKCMQHRINWKEVNPNAPNYFNFKWQHTSTGIDFSSLSKNSSIKQVVNHYEFHSSISNKLNLFLNLMKYCEKKNLEVFKIIPLTIIIQYDSPSFAGQMEAIENFYDYLPNYVASWKSQEDNTFTDNLIKYANIFKLGISNDKLGYKTTAYIEDSHYNGKNLWIVKAPDLNRGRCIKIADSVDAMKKILKQFYEGIFRDFKNLYEDDVKNNNESSPVINPNCEKNKDNKKEKKFDNDYRKYRANSVVIQKYIESPLLYWGRKFDVRMWVMITHKLDVYCYREGHLKTSSIPYDLYSADSYVHLTNYSVQKYNKEFSKFEQGNEVSFSDFQNFLNKEYGEGKVSVAEHIYPKICHLIKIVAFSVKDKINKNDRKYSFEIFGFDFIIDKDLELFLLEVNTNPGLEESSNLIKMLLPRMIDDAMKLTIDDIFETKYSSEVDILLDKNNLYSPYPVEGYSDRDNLWDFVVNMNDDV